MHNAYVVTGTLVDAQTVALDESLPLDLTKVRLIIEPLTSQPRRPIQEVMAAIRKRQAERGYQPVPRETIDQYLEDERSTWDN